MRTERCSSSRNGAGRFDEEEKAANQLEGKVRLGAIIWVRPDICSWWPAQVVDENAVSENKKPRKTSADEVLVRLYGSYKYLYADPMKCRSDFDSILQQNNGNYRDIFQKSLDQEITRSKSGRLNGQGSRSGEKVVRASEDEKLKQNKVREKKKVEASNSLSLALIKTRGSKANSATKNAAASSFVVRVSPRRKLPVHSQQAEMSNGSSLVIRVEEKSLRTPEKDGLQKRLTQDDQSWKRETRSSCKKGEMRTSVFNHRTRGSKANSATKNAAASSFAARVSPRRKLPVRSQQAEMSNGSSSMIGVEPKKDGLQKRLSQDDRSWQRETRSSCKKSEMQNELLQSEKELDVKDPGGADIMKSRTSMKVGLSKKHKENRRNRAEDLKGKIPEQNNSNVEETNHRTAGCGVRMRPRELAGNKSSKQGRGPKKLELSVGCLELEEGSKALVKKAKPDGQSNGETNQKISKKSGKENPLKRNRQTSEQGRAHKKLKANSPRSDYEAKNKQLVPEMDHPFYVATALGKSPGSHARRMKVMQSLGLVAPFGSLFG